MSGQIPPELGLTGLLLSHNRLSGQIPPELGNLPNLRVLTISGNELTGCAPERLRDVDQDFDDISLPFCD